MQKHEGIRIGPDGQVAQRVPESVRQGGGPRWLLFHWPEEMLTAKLLFDDDVADWKPAHTQGD